MAVGWHGTRGDGGAASRRWAGRLAFGGSVLAVCMLAACSFAPSGPVSAQSRGSRAGQRTRPEPPRKATGADETNDPLAAAREALRAGDYAAAQEAFGKIAARGAQPARAAARLGLARVQLETGRYDAAAKTAQAAASAAGARSMVRVKALTVAGAAHLACGRWDAAQAAWRKAASLPQAHRAQVRLGRLLALQGDRAAAERAFLDVIEAYNAGRIDDQDPAGLTSVAMAAWGLGSLHEANDMFRQAASLDGARADTQLEWGRLFFEKYDTKNAGESALLVLRRNKRHADAHVLLAEIALRERHDFGTAEEALARALETNPHHARAHALRGGMALLELDFARADAHLDQALRIDPKHLTALSIRAAARFLEGDRDAFEAAKRAVLDISPTYSRMYAIIGQFAEWEHRYRALVGMAREALRIDAQDPSARAMLGINLLRLGDEEAGLEALRQAWEIDRFNVRVYNLLNFYEKVVGTEYEDFSAGPFRFRMHKTERPILARYAVPLLTRGYREFEKRYGFTPDGPLRMELYADREHFSVRTTGLPSAGVQGVCFGKVVTALSPGGGPFNWGQIAWHELAHVFHLQMSHNRVPRWFTEGLAEYETLVSRAEWQREDDHNLWLALEGGRLPALKSLNRAFTHAQSAEEMMAAYYAAAMAVKYIVERYGMDKVNDMLHAWGRGERTEAIVQGVLGVDIEQLDSDFRAHTRKRLAAYERDFFVDFERYADLGARQKAAAQQPDDLQAQAALAAAHWRAGQPKAAERVARRVIDSDPKHPLAHYVLARVAVGKRNPLLAEAHLRKVLEGGKDGYVIRLLLGHSELARGALQDARKELEAATRIDPARTDAWHALVALAEKLQDEALRLRALRAVVNLDQHDRRASADLLAALAERQAWADVVEYAERALLLDPARAETHRVLAEGYLRTGRSKRALEELEVALLADHQAPGDVHRLRAEAFASLGRRSEALRAAQQAVEADPKLSNQLQQIMGGSAPRP